jgi:hypothetical protein
MWIKVINVSMKTIKFLEENMGGTSLVLDLTWTLRDDSESISNTTKNGFFLTGEMHIATNKYPVLLSEW